MYSFKKPLISMVILSVALAYLPPVWAQLHRPSAARSSSPVYFLKEVEKRIYRFTNEARRQQGLPPLDQDADLVTVARGHTQDMLQRHFFSHVDPDGRAPQDRIAPAFANTIARAGENLWGGRGLDYRDSLRLARVIVDSWMTSPGHRTNILNPAYTHLGVGVGILGPEICATQNFVQQGRP